MPENTENTENTKSGRRHSESDMLLGRKLKGMAGEIVAGMDALGFTDTPAPVEWTPPAEAEKALLSFGTEVKALGGGRVGGYLVRFSSADAPDLYGDFFTADTDFGEHDTAPVIYDHGLDDTLKRRVLGKGKLRPDQVGVWIESQLQLRDEYEQAIYALAEQGKLGWSSGTAAHLVEREPAGRAYRIKSWPLGLDASLTPTPAEPRNAAMTLKAYVEAKSLQPAAPPNGGPRPASKGAQDEAYMPAVPVTSLKEKQTMPEETAPVNPELTAEFTKLLDAINGIGATVQAVKSDVDALKSLPAERTPGVAGKTAEMLADGRPPAHNVLARETLADEQLSALKSLLRGELGRDAWKEHQKKVAANSEREVNAWKAFIRNPLDGGLRHAYEESLKASLVEGTASLGGNLVPKLYSNQVVGTLMEDSVVRRAGAYQFPVAGTNSFNVPKITRSGSAPLAAELAAGSQMEPTFANQEFIPYAYRAMYIASRELMLDTRIPLDSILMENAGWQLTQSENVAFGVGTGSGQPQGIAAAASTLALSPGSTLALALTGDNLIEVYHGLPYQYRNQAVWFMNDAAIKQIRKLKWATTTGAGSTTTYNQYLWTEGLQTGQPPLLLGRPVYTLNTMATSGSTANVVVFGDPRFFWIADFNNGGMDFQVLNELYALSAAVGWWFWRRIDSHLLVSEAVVGMKLLS